jgi:uncharacterized protein (TIGR03066 family)
MQRIVLASFTFAALVAIAGCGSSSTTALPVVAPGGSGGSNNPAPRKVLRGPEQTIDGKLLVGTWMLPEPKEMPKEKGGGKIMVTLDFTADGKAKVTESVSGKDRVVVDGNYQQEASQINISAKKEGKEMPITLTIVKLTDTELTLSDPEKGEVDLRFIRKK